MKCKKKLKKKFLIEVQRCVQSGERQCFNAAVFLFFLLCGGNLAFRDRL